MPSGADSTKALQVYKTDFICNKENVLWLLGQPSFYSSCKAFAKLEGPVRELSVFMQDNGLSTGTKEKKGCSKCAASKAVRAQGQLLDAFAKIFLWLYDQDRMQELHAVREFVSNRKGVGYKRILLAYSGKATKGQNRLAVI